jgi:hypothetical protein
MQKYKRERTYGNNTQRGFSKEQQKGRRLSGFTGLRIKTQWRNQKNINLEVEGLVRLED